MMPLVRYGGFAMAGAAAIAAASAAQQAPPTQPNSVPAKVTPERVIAGSEIFNGRSCVLCHAPGGRGEGPSAPDLSDARWLHSSGDYDGIHRTIVWGVEADEMSTPRQFEMFPGGGVNLATDEIEAVAAYVWSLSRPESSGFVAAQGLFIERARAGRGDEAVAFFRARLVDSPPRTLLPERGLNRLGQSLLAGQTRSALAIFRLNAELHPRSGPAFAGMGDAYRALGDRARAAESYRRVLAINPANEAVRQKLREVGG